MGNKNICSSGTAADLKLERIFRIHHNTHANDIKGTKQGNFCSIYFIDNIWG